MINYIRGYYTLTIEGIGTEKFLNFLISNKVKVYNIKRINSTKIEVSIDRKDIKSFKKAYKGNVYKVVVKKKIGLPFLAIRMYKNKILWMGAIISLMILMATTKFVTDVYIDAPEGINKEAVKKELYNIGLKPGTYKDSIDRKEIREYMMAKFEDIAYLSINVEGTNIFVTITKKTESLEANESSNYCNIIAKKNGIVEEVIVRSGKTLVESGNVVREGDVLINGANTKSLPEIWATIYYDVETSTSCQEIIKEKTGKSKNVYTFMFYDSTKTIRKKIDYDTYIIENKEYKISIGDYTFPLKINVSTFYETKEHKIDLDKNKLKEELQQEAIKEIEYLLPVSARNISSKGKYTVEDNMLKYKVTVKSLENIGKVQNLTNAQAELIIKEEENKENEEVQHNKEKRPINDIRNQLDLDTDDKKEN